MVTSRNLNGYNVLWSYHVSLSTTRHDEPIVTGGNNSYATQSANNINFNNSTSHSFYNISVPPWSPTDNMSTILNASRCFAPVLVTTAGDTSLKNYDMTPHHHWYNGTTTVAITVNR